MNEYKTILHGKEHGTRGTLHEKLEHIANTLGKDMHKLTAKEAHEKGFRIKRTSHDPYYSHPQKNHGGKE